MIQYLGELNRVLLVVHRLMDEKGEASVSSVTRKCAEMVVGARMPDHETTIAFAVRLGLLIRVNELLVLNQDGTDFLGFNPAEDYDLTIEQRRLLLKRFYLHGPLREETEKVLRSFAPAYEERKYRWSSVDSPRMEGPRWLVEHLTEIGLITRKSTDLEISGPYAETVASLLDENKGLTLEEFERLLKERRQVGDIAEKMILRFESERLRGIGATVESQCIRLISVLRSSAGYDIESFDSSSSSLSHDRFIEVKGGRGGEVSFIWSDNEMRVAKTLGPKYWIYFQGGIDLSTLKAKYRPVLFQDPSRTIPEDARLKISPHAVLVRGGIRGEPSAP